ncbi:MAG: phospholipase A [Gammaproteobacteria bacterium]|nr:phospholipase A [Gammaproteobacteria bacterium]MBU1447411.1 phospholipase A [Gammaproteobacteria bacterium]
MVEPANAAGRLLADETVTSEDLAMLRILYAICFCLIGTAHAATPNWKTCASIGNQQERLACYDQLTGHRYNQRSALTRAWDLDGLGNPDSAGVRRLEPYRANRVMVQHTSRINVQPASPAHFAPPPYPYQPNELKFQFSAKSEIGNFRELELLWFRDFRLWAGFTQQSFWQLFNGAQSSPFRETNYEPELIGTFGTGHGEGWKLLNIGLSHQSNGRGNHLSRSWNRIYAQSGWESGDYYLLARGWWRLPESTSNDDNPDIQQYLGKVELEAHWSPDSDDEVTLLARSNLSLDQPRGYLQLDWSTPVRIWHLSHLSLQLASGYGHNLIDYNHNQTSFSFGLTFKDW